MEADADLWQSCLSLLAQEIPEQQFNTWIRPILAEFSPDQAKITLFVANRFKLDWVRAQYSQRISAVLEKTYGQPVSFELVLTPREIAARSFSRPNNAEPQDLVEDLEGLEDRNAGPARNRINLALSFESLVEGSANRMARAAAMHVASFPGQLYNPLFIYGGSVWAKRT